MYGIYRVEAEEQKSQVRQTERDKSQLIDQLTEQNQRLTTQLKEVHYMMLFVHLTSSLLLRVTLLSLKVTPKGVYSFG